MRFASLNFGMAKLKISKVPAISSGYLTKSMRDAERHGFKVLYADMDEFFVTVNEEA